MDIWLCAHEPMASALKQTVAHIVGATETEKRLHALDLMMGQDPSTYCLDLLLHIKSNPQREWLILVDLLGGSPMNALWPILDMANVLVVSGVNLPITLQALKSSSLYEFTECMQLENLENEYRNVGVFNVSARLKSTEGN